MREIIAELIFFAIIAGIPAGFLIGSIENFLKLRKAKQSGETPAKKNKIFSIVFLVLFILTIYFYINIYISFTRAISSM